MTYEQFFDKIQRLLRHELPVYRRHTFIRHKRDGALQLLLILVKAGFCGAGTYKQEIKPNLIYSP